MIMMMGTILEMIDAQDGNSRNKSGLSTFLAVWTADEWGSVSVIIIITIFSVITIIIIFIVIIIMIITTIKSSPSSS